MLFETSSLGSSAFVAMVRAAQFVTGTAPAYREVPLELDTGRKFVLQLELFSCNARLIVCGLTRAIQAVRKFMQIEP